MYLLCGAHIIVPMAGFTKVAMFNYLIPLNHTFQRWLDDKFNGLWKFVGNGLIWCEQTCLSMLGYQRNAFTDLVVRLVKQ